MKKYFVVETDEVCEFGDILNITLSKELEDGKVTVEKELKFTEETADWLVETGFVEERDTEEDESLMEFVEDEPCRELSNLIEDFENLEERVDNMEQCLKEIHAFITAPEKKGKPSKADKK